MLHEAIGTMTFVTNSSCWVEIRTVAVYALSYVGEFLIDVVRYFAVVGVESDIGRCESDFFTGRMDDFLLAYVGFSGDFTEDHGHVGFLCRFHMRLHFRGLVLDHDHVGFGIG
ncbi:hypothetical protein L1887_12652 [Cichorium endivia]|nr:hypothetical protein L1887_12652 [Cichorium endivia]